MQRTTIYVKETDRMRIEQLFMFCEIFKEEEKRSIRRLQFEVSEGIVVPDDQIPPDVVAIDAKVLLKDLGTGQEFWMSLVFPEEADAQNNRISVLAPISRCLLGARVGEIVNCYLLTGSCYLKILKVINRPEIDDSLSECKKNFENVSCRGCGTNQ
jgi:regulator of nucleoside diphosphate kinase